MSNMCEECFWYWGYGEDKKSCHNESIKALRQENNKNEYCYYFEDKFLGNPPVKDITKDYCDGRWKNSG